MKNIFFYVFQEPKVYSAHSLVKQFENMYVNSHKKHWHEDLALTDLTHL